MKRHLLGIGYASLIVGANPDAVVQVDKWTADKLAYLHSQCSENLWDLVSTGPMQSCVASSAKGKICCWCPNSNPNPCT